jgi:hypothetical protein
VTATAHALRRFAFGDLDEGTWGTAWLPSVQGAGIVALGAAGESRSLAAELEGTSDSAEWHLEAEGASLIVSPEGEAVGTPQEGGIEGFDQLCRVRGRIRLGGSEQSAEALGCRGLRAGSIDGDQFESIREVSAWFEPDQGMVLTALRPRGSRGHDADVVTAAILGERAATVGDPRLSTTYTAQGRPARAGLELWLSADEEAQEQEAATGEAPPEDRRYPRRASGQAVGARVELGAEGLQAQAELFRWHSQGLEGAGVYLLARL